jgi:hypothetical protein
MLISDVKMPLLALLALLALEADIDECERLDMVLTTCFEIW